jgi:hypothetical protein
MFSPPSDREEGMRARFIHTTSRASDRLPAGQTRGRARIVAPRLPGIARRSTTALVATALVLIVGLGALVWWIADAGTDGAVAAGLAVLGPVVVVAVYASVFTGPRGK